MQNRRRRVVPDFERHWRRRFSRYASTHDDDAGIAGWSKTGLEARYLYFVKAWLNHNRGRQTEGNVWLDAGCGAGTYVRFLTEHGCDVIGMDYSPASIVKARARTDSSVIWLVADVRRLPFKQQTFDGALSFGVTQALAQSDALVAELASSVRDGGQVWVDALNAWCLPNLWDSIKRWLRRRPLHVRYESPGHLRRLFERCGLRDVEVYWVPVFPSTFPTLQKVAQSRLMDRLLKHVPGLGPILCHSVLVRGRKRGQTGQ